jgi:hypothetical protein
MMCRSAKYHGIVLFFEECTTSRAMQGLLITVQGSVLLSEDALDATRRRHSVTRAVSRAIRLFTQRAAILGPKVPDCFSFTRHHVCSKYIRIIALSEPATGQLTCRRETTDEMVRRQQWHRVMMFIGTKGLWHNIQLISLCFGFCDDLANSRLDIDFSRISTRTTPCSLTCCKYAVDHVDPIEEWINDEHERVQHDFVATQLRAKV